MADSPNSADWITAVSTAATAVATLITGLIAWFALRGGWRDKLPVVEADFRKFPIVHFVVRNRLPETIDITAAIVRKPKGAIIHREEWTQGQGAIQQRGPSTDGSKRIEINYRVAPYGTSANPMSFVIGDETDFNIYVVPPEGWSSGNVIIDLLISSRARTLRDKRIAIKRFARLAPKMSTASKGITQIPS